MEQHVISRDSSPVRIAAFSAAGPGQMQSRIGDAARRLQSTRSRESAVEALFRNQCASFSPDDPFRIILVVPPGGDMSAMLNQAAAITDESDPRSAGPSGDIPPGIFTGRGKPPGKAAFLFPGQGSQYVGMGNDVIRLFPAAGDAFELMEKTLEGDMPLSRMIFPENADCETPDAGEKARMESALRQTDIAQPAIGAVSLSMLKALAGFGMTPDAAAGHSFGELTALCAGNRLAEKDFCRLAVWRGRLMAAAGGSDSGQMLAVKASPDEIARIVQQSGLDVVVANKNSPEQGVVSGRSDEIEKMLQLCKKNRVRAMVLPVSAAFHSPLVASAAAGFYEKIASVSMKPSAIPVYSNKTALPYPAETDDAMRLFGQHLSSPVNFMDMIQNMYSDGVRVFVEVGPKNALTGLVKTILRGDAPKNGNEFDAFSVDASSGKQGGLYDLALSVARLAAAGYPVDPGAWPFDGSLHIKPAGL